MSEHKFWSTQPVPQQEIEKTEFGPIEIKTVEEVRKEELPLPTGYEWYSFDVSSDKDVCSCIHV